MEKVKYVKCPRCDINYMKSTERICDVCIAELSRKLGTDEDEDDDKVLCPVCNKNFIEMDDEMCSQCLSEKEETPIIGEEPDEEWRAFLDDDKDLPVDEEMISLSELEIEEQEEEDDEYVGEPLDDLDDFDATL